jgi:hypothetical protein
MLANPFIVYVASFAGVIAAYQLGWSEAYPDLSPALLAFFATTFAAAALLAWLTVGDTRSAARYEPGRLPSFVVWPLIASFAADIVYTGYVPLFSSFTRGFVFSGEIGVPSLHVFNGTFGATFSAIRFCDFLQRRRARDLAEAIVPIVFLLLILYRGPGADASGHVVFCLAHQRRPQYTARNRDRSDRLRRAVRLRKDR